MSEELITSGQWGLGWRRDQERADFLAPLVRAFAFMAPGDAPPVIDHRNWLQTENQGGMGSCAGHAGADCAQVCNWIATRGEAVRMSRMFCYLTGQQESGLFGRDAGASISGVVSAMHKIGVPREETFPYPGVYTTRIPQQAFQEAEEHRIRSVSPMQRYADCFAFLALGIGAIQIGIDWTSSLANDRTGVIDRVWGGTLGGHSLSLVGYSARRDDEGRQYLWMHNSHGKSWGNRGWAEVSPRVIDHWLLNFNSGEFLGVSDLAAYERRWIDPSQFA
ncbi:MAG: C1 family peptidase [Planctomycetales bacterium]